MKNDNYEIFLTMFKDDSHYECMKYIIDKYTANIEADKLRQVLQDIQMFELLTSLNTNIKVSIYIKNKIKTAIKHDSDLYIHLPERFVEL